MLKEITIKNFKSYNNEVTFSMEADYERVSEHENHIVDISNNKLLKVTSMYGPNGGGKTNLLNAIAFIKTVVVNKGYPLNPRQVTNVFNENKYTEFTVFFVDDNYEYGYKIELLPTIIEEQFDVNISGYVLKTLIKNEMVIYRRKDENDFITLYERNEYGEIDGMLIDKLNISMSKISNYRTVLGKFYDDYANDTNDIECINVISGLYNQFELITNLGSKVDKQIRIDKKYLDFINDNKNYLVRYLNSVDIKISNINVYNIGKPEKIYFEREIELNGKVIKKEIPLSDESKGTIKIFFIMMEIMKCIKDNKIYCFDDMNAYLHPKLCASIIEQFSNQTNTYAQLIFNSHDMINMNNSLFRRDEIWFVYRDEEYSSVLVPLSNIVNYKGQQIRNDAKYSKQYLEGRFGSDPYIMKGINWYE